MYFMTENCVNIAAFTDDIRIAEDLLVGACIRSDTLEIMYREIPGLHEAALETKNYIYRALRKKIEALYGRRG